MLITGGLAPLAGPPDRVYRATFQRVAARNAEYFARYPEDRAPGHPDRPASASHGGVPARRRAGSPWSGSRWWASSWAATPGWTPCTTCWRMPSSARPTATGSPTPSWTRSAAQVSRAANPLYALMHESIYGQGEATDWAAWRVLQELPEFRPDAAEPLLTGEMVYPWYFEQDPALAPAAAGGRGCWPTSTDWTPLYDPDRLAAQHRPRGRGRVPRRHLRRPRRCPWKPPAAVRGCRCGRPPTSTTTGSPTTARRSSPACWGWPAPPR